MKKFLFIFSILFIVACSDTDTTDDLQAQITELEETVEALRNTISGLQTTNTTLTSRIDQAIQDLDAAELLIQQLRGDLTTTQSSLTLAVNANATAEERIEELQGRLSDAQAAINGASYSDVVNLGATGTVAEQTPEQAQQTIYGKWDIGSSSAKGANCTFDFFEFSDENYILSINTPDGKAQVFGTYAINETASGTVENVTLLWNDAGTERVIATLTNIVVEEETDSTLTATFDITLQLPEALQTCQANLEGDVTAGKDEPTSVGANGDDTIADQEDVGAFSNHALIVGDWRLTSFVENGEELIQDQYRYACIDESTISYNEETGEETYETIAGCDVNAMVINFSDYGTYLLAAVNANGSNARVEVDDWYWVSADQDRIGLVFQDGDEVDTEEYDIEIDLDRLVLTRQYFDISYDFDPTTGEDVMTEERVTARISLVRD